MTNQSTPDEYTSSVGISGRLQFLWKEYIGMIELLITLLTGSLALSVGLVKLGSQEVVQRKGLFLVGVLLLVASLLLAFLWRSLAQLFMEQEVLGKPDALKKYYSDQGLEHPFTYYAHVVRSVQVQRVSRISMVLTIACMIAGLATLGIFVYLNL